MNKLTKDKVINFLFDHGFEISTASLLRYGQNGFIIYPIRKLIKGTSIRPIYYHPISLIEAMTAFLLFKGALLDTNSKTRVVRFTARDLFFSRIIFFKNNLDYLKTTKDYYMNIDAYPIYDIPKNQLYMTADNIKRYCESIEPLYCNELGISENTSLGESYKKFIYELYSYTFNDLYSKYYNQIINDFS